ncbi:hypothetical protein GCM10022267_89320 [Lentzea roselyniae]|uniref:Short chain dehydrogenase n=1 Tax=Lentzea roselyniae TaxID=531940 RepID=A0ABP7CHD2_9PSEU
MVATSSRSHRAADLTPGRVGDQLADSSGLSPHQRYARAKPSLLLLHEDKRRRHPGLEIVDVHPGIVASDFGRYLGWLGAVLKTVAAPVLTSPAAAAAHLIHLATIDDDLAATYYHRRQPGRPSRLVVEPDLREEVRRIADVHFTPPKDSPPPRNR